MDFRRSVCRASAVPWGILGLIAAPFDGRAQCLVVQVGDLEAIRPGRELQVLVEPPSESSMPKSRRFRYHAEPLEELGGAIASRLRDEMTGSGFFRNVVLAPPHGQPETDHRNDLVLRAEMRRVSPFGLRVEVYQFVPIPPLLPMNGASLVLEGELADVRENRVWMRWACAAQSFGTWFQGDRSLMRRNTRKVARSLRQELDRVLSEGPVRAKLPGRPLVADQGPVPWYWTVTSPDTWRDSDAFGPASPQHRGQPARPWTAVSSPDPSGTLLALARAGRSTRGERVFVVCVYYFKRAWALWDHETIAASARLQGDAATGLVTPSNVREVDPTPARIQWGFELRGKVFRTRRDVLWGVNSLELEFPLDMSECRASLFRPRLTLEIDGRPARLDFPAAIPLCGKPR
jgi:hypothetical protein